MDDEGEQHSQTKYIGYTCDLSGTSVWENNRVPSLPAISNQFD